MYIMGALSVMRQMQSSSIIFEKKLPAGDKTDTDELTDFWINSTTHTQRALLNPRDPFLVFSFLRCPDARWDSILKFQEDTVGTS